MKINYKRISSRVTHFRVNTRLALSLGLGVGIVLLVIFFLNFPLFSQRPRRSLNSPHTNIVRHSFTLPVVSLQHMSQLDLSKVLDQSMQSSGCGALVTVMAGTTTNIGIHSGNKDRTYLLYVPRHFSNATSHPVIVSFHGYASNATVQERLTHFTNLADKDGIILVFPQGTTGILAARGWNTGIHPTITANDVLFVSNMLNQLQSNFCVDPHRIYATGFSNGGGMVGLLACKLPNRIAAFAPISGSYLPSFTTCNDSRPVSIVEFHGTADRTVPYDGLASLREISTQFWLSNWAKKDGCTQKPQLTKESAAVTRYDWSHCQGNAEIIHYKIIGGRHVWPSVRFNQNDAGQKQIVDTTSLIWSFFQRHPLQSS